VTTRRTLIAALAALAPVLAACASPARAPAPATQTTASALVTGGPGWVTVRAPAHNPDAPALRIQGAALHPGAPHGGQELRVSITNDSAVPEHLYAITTAAAATVQLFTAPPTANQAPPLAPASGITLAPGATIRFGPGGPRILLTNLTGPAPGHTITLNLVFAVAGQVPLTVTRATAPQSGGAGR
jgi:copper(I)-binding protein